MAVKFTMNVNPSRILEKAEENFEAEFTLSEEIGEKLLSGQHRLYMVFEYCPKTEDFTTILAKTVEKH